MRPIPSLFRFLLLTVLLSCAIVFGEAQVMPQEEPATVEQASPPVAPPPNSFETWSWPKRIAFVAIIMGAIVIVSQTLGKYEWPAEWGGLPKEGGIPLRPEDQLAKREAAAKAKTERPSAEGRKPNVPES
jgi:hypothetical protein